jgi:hypothetical protein
LGLRRIPRNVQSLDDYLAQQAVVDDAEEVGEARVDMDKVIELWLRDHPGGTVEDYTLASRPFGAERGSRHRRAHHAFLDWLKMPHIQRALFGKEAAS